MRVRSRAYARRHVGASVGGCEMTFWRSSRGARHRAHDRLCWRGSSDRSANQIGLLHGFWSLRASSIFKRQFDCAGHCNALLSWHGNHAPVSLSAIAGSELIAAFAGLPRIRVKVAAAIYTIRLKVGRSLSVSLSGVRQHRNQAHRKAGN